ncbi:hypothetical protein CVU75_02635 [Candidatus Dependentiae bacterium HGW-Dependentiae-1]|nr:MAG: hypothetical protein CVU75_02635 [Candidatus Dependentiae bacterium HGW-Dependentiae-1]
MRYLLFFWLSFGFIASSQAMQQSPEAFHASVSAFAYQIVQEGISLENCLRFENKQEQANLVGRQNQSLLQCLTGEPSAGAVVDVLGVIKQGVQHVHELSAQARTPEIYMALCRLSCLLAVLPDVESDRFPLAQSLEKIGLEAELKLITQTAQQQELIRQQQEQEQRRVQERLGRRLRMIPYWCPSPVGSPMKQGFFVWGPAPMNQPLPMMCQDAQNFQYASLPTPPLCFDTCQQLVQTHGLERSVGELAGMGCPKQKVGSVGVERHKERPHPAPIQTCFSAPASPFLLQSSSASRLTSPLENEQETPVRVAGGQSQSAQVTPSSTTSVCQQLFRLLGDSSHA